MKGAGRGWAWRGVWLLLAGALILSLARSEGLGDFAWGWHTLRPDDGILHLAQGSGAQYVVQVFSWNEIEPTPGEFFWEYPDWLVRAAEYYGLAVIARLDNAPGWATGPHTSLSAPPRDPAAMAQFAARVADRYRGRVSAYIVGNEPNLAREWGNLPPNPAAYAELLRETGAAIRRADPAARVVAAGLASTNQDDASAMDDRLYLRALYAAGARGAFDVLAAHPYGFGRTPLALRDTGDGLVFARVEDLRRLMVEAGDAHTPLWITEFGYTTQADAGDPRQQVTESAQSAYLAEAAAVLRRKYPYVERLTVWNLARAGERPAGDEQMGYSMLRADDTQKPALMIVKAATADREPRAAVRDDRAIPGNPPTAPVLAPDVVIHLGDSEYPRPWVPLYQNRNPAPQWTGQFYLERSDLEGAWSLQMELMQVNDRTGRVLVNERPVEPPSLPVGDFTGIWVTARFAVPRALLREGMNTVTVRAGKLVPALQQYGFTWDDFQLRNVRLRRVSP